jgi:tyrosyl-tRNA synthetase
VRRIHGSDGKLAISGNTEERFASAADEELRQGDLSRHRLHAELVQAMLPSGCEPARSTTTTIMIINAHLVHCAPVKDGGRSVTHRGEANSVQEPGGHAPATRGGGVGVEIVMIPMSSSRIMIFGD